MQQRLKSEWRSSTGEDFEFEVFIKKASDSKEEQEIRTHAWNFIPSDYGIFDIGEISERVEQVKKELSLKKIYFYVKEGQKIKYKILVIIGTIPLTSEKWNEDVARIYHTR